MLGNTNVKPHQYQGAISTLTPSLRVYTKERNYITAGCVICKYRYRHLLGIIGMVNINSRLYDVSEYGVCTCICNGCIQLIICSNYMRSSIYWVSTLQFIGFGKIVSVCSRSTLDWFNMCIRPSFIVMSRSFLSVCIYIKEVTSVCHEWRQTGY